MVKAREYEVIAEPIGIYMGFLSSAFCVVNFNIPSESLAILKLELVLCASLPYKLFKNSFAICLLAPLLSFLIFEYFSI